MADVTFHTTLPPVHEVLSNITKSNQALEYLYTHLNRRINEISQSSFQGSSRELIDESEFYDNQVVNHLRCIKTYEWQSKQHQQTDEPSEEIQSLERFIKRYLKNINNFAYDRHIFSRHILSHSIFEPIVPPYNSSDQDSQIDSSSSIMLKSSMLTLSITIDNKSLTGDKEDVCNNREVLLYRKKGKRKRKPTTHFASTEKKGKKADL